MASNMKTVDTETATIRFTGGLDGSESDSSGSTRGAPVTSHTSSQHGNNDSKANIVKCDNLTSHCVNKSEKILCNTLQPQGNLTQESTIPKFIQEDVLCNPTEEPIHSPKTDNVDNERIIPVRQNPFNDEDVDHMEVFPQLNDKSLQREGSSSPEWLSDDECSSPVILHIPTIEEELGLSEDHFAQPEGILATANMDELQAAVDRCKLLISTAPTNSDRMKDLVQKLIQLRLKLAEAKEAPKEVDPSMKVVLGHHFMVRDASQSKHYCEKCSAVIWNVLQKWYRCEACGFCCHEKCLNLIARTCASVKVTECPQYILHICPEHGLPSQNYRCAECRIQLSFEKGHAEPRLCDYTGNFYCDQCHWNNTMIVPARVLHNWDFELQKVSRASKQFLRLMLKRPVIRVQDINPMLFNFVDELNQVKKLREEILIMKKYFLSCKGALGSKLLLQLQERQHFVENSDMYSLQDLQDVAEDILLPQLTKIHASFAQHIKTDCQLCQGKGYVCELCEEREILFPFDNIAIVCAQCSTVLHRHCYMRRGQKCPKCDRLSRRIGALNEASPCPTPLALS